MASTATFEFPSFTKTVHRAAYPAIDPKNPANSAAGKVVVVTGGGAGIGKNIAAAFVAAGAKTVAILGRRAHVLEESKKEFEQIGSSKILSYAVDVIDEVALSRAFADVAKEAGPIDVVVANAGYLSALASAVTIDVGEWWKAVEINVKGTLLTFRAFAAHKSAHSPTFISINTAGAHVGFFPRMSSYSTSKLGLLALMATLQNEEAEIRSVSYHPGVIESDMFYKAEVPMKPDDMSLPSAFAVWLASPAADWTGGRFLWAHWDVSELVEMKEEILAKDELKPGITGWPKLMDAKLV